MQPTATTSRPAQQPQAALTAELIERLRRTTFLLNSARLVIADPVARAIAAEAVAEARATLAKVAP